MKCQMVFVEFFFHFLEVSIPFCSANLSFALLLANLFVCLLHKYVDIVSIVTCVACIALSCCQLWICCMRHSDHSVATIYISALTWKKCARCDMLWVPNKKLAAVCKKLFFRVLLVVCLCIGSVVLSYSSFSISYYPKNCSSVCREFEDNTVNLHVDISNMNFIIILAVCLK